MTENSHANENVCPVCITEIRGFLKPWWWCALSDSTTVKDTGLCQGIAPSIMKQLNPLYRHYEAMCTTAFVFISIHVLAVFSVHPPVSVPVESSLSLCFHLVAKETTTVLGSTKYRKLPPRVFLTGLSLKVVLAFFSRNAPLQVMFWSVICDSYYYSRTHSYLDEIHIR